MPLVPVIVFLVGVGPVVMPLMPVIVFFVGVSAVVMPLMPVIVFFVGVSAVVMLPMIMPLVVVAMLSCHNGILTQTMKAAPHLGRGAAALYHWPFVGR